MTEEPRERPDEPAEEPITPDEAGRSEPAEPAAGAETPDGPPPESDSGVTDEPVSEEPVPSEPEPVPSEPEPVPTEPELTAEAEPDADAELGVEAEAVADEPAPAPGDEPAPETPEQAAAGLTPGEAQAATDELVETADETTAATDPEYIEDSPREKPVIPGADLEVDIVPEGSDPLQRERDAAAERDYLDPEEVEVPAEAPAASEDEVVVEPVTPAQAVIDLGADARYRATGKRKTAVARVILRPGSGRYTVNGHPLDDHFPRPTLQRNIRQPLETVGYDGRMDVVAKLHGGGVSSQAGALRHGISRALIEADPNLRAELKRRGFLTRDPRVKERKKAGLKKARKRPQFSKR